MVLGNICEPVCFLVGSNRSQVFLFIVPYSFFKKIFSKILQNSIVYEIQRKTPTPQSLFHKFATLLKKETLIQMFSWEVCNFFFRPVLLQRTNCYDYNFNCRHKWFCIRYIDLPHRIFCLSQTSWGFRLTENSFADCYIFMSKDVFITTSFIIFMSLLSHTDFCKGSLLTKLNILYPFKILDRFQINLNRWLAD